VTRFQPSFHLSIDCVNPRSGYRVFGSRIRHTWIGPAILTSTTPSPKPTVPVPPPYFSFDRPGDVVAYARKLDLLPDTGGADVQRPGEGNMNFVARVRVGDRSIILKQSRPWVEKYPSIDAPVNRIHTEVEFYRSIAKNPALQRCMPRLLHYDADRFVAVFEDIGDTADYTTLYAGDPAPKQQVHDDLRILLKWLSRLHELHPEAGYEPIRNREMRALNHAHIFEIPLAPDNGVDLDAITPGLERTAERLRKDPAFVGAVTELGGCYLSDGTSLLHGDFYPGSWVRSEKGPMVIDPEFAFHGPAEFDIGVCRAHLLLSGMAGGDIDDLFSSCFDSHLGDASMVAGFAGVEIMRRLLGVAQLPLERTASEKEGLLSLSRQLILGHGL